MVGIYQILVLASIILCLIAHDDALELHNRALVSSYEENAYVPMDKGAIIVTLAGQTYLAEYFLWTCLTVEKSSSLFDMLVFHESNEKLKNIKCGSNVKFIDLGINGLSNLIVDTVFTRKNMNPDTLSHLKQLTAQVINHIPRYLVEIKPLSGKLFAKWLEPYSHWTYTDPDIMWGDLTQWLSPEIIGNYEIVTVAKQRDSGRLFLRGQFALHRNSEPTNSLWMALSYMQPQSFA